MLVCLLSRLADAPVKWLETRAESLLVERPPFHPDPSKSATTTTGVLLGVHVRMLGDVGSLATWGGWGMVFNGCDDLSGAIPLRRL